MGYGSGRRKGKVYLVSHTRPSDATCFFVLSSLATRSCSVSDSMGDANCRSLIFYITITRLSAFTRRPYHQCHLHALPAYLDVPTHITLYRIERHTAQDVEQARQALGGLKEFGGGDGVVFAGIDGHLGEGALGVVEVRSAGWEGLGGHGYGREMCGSRDGNRNVEQCSKSRVICCKRKVVKLTVKLIQRHIVVVCCPGP